MTPVDQGNTWNPISEEEFRRLFQEQYEQLDPTQRRRLEPFLVPIWQAQIQRSAEAGIESVFVVAQSGSGVLYFDDVEDGFNISDTENGRIVSRGGAQSSLAEAVDWWLPER